MGKKQNTVKPKTKATMSPIVVDRLWDVVKEVAVNRAKTVENDSVKTRRIFEVAEAAKREFIINNYPALMDGEQVMADDVLAVLTTMTLMIASDMFEGNEAIMAQLNAPTNNALKPHTHTDGNPLYV